MKAPKMSIPRLAVSLGAALVALTFAGVAAAACCAPPPPPTNCCAPPPPPPRPPAPPACGNSCGGGHNINVPGVKVYVGGSVIVNANASATATSNASAGAGSGAGASAGSTVYYGGGTHGGYYSGPMSTGYIQGLNVEMGEACCRTARTSYEATRTKFTRVVIRAVCLDDRDVPHPASQVTPDRDIDNGYDGELYRCIAGARLQYMVGEYDSSIDISHGGRGGQSYICAKNDALYFAPGAQGGAVSCRPQRPARDCNERSLLRRYGAGIKVLTMMTTERYTAYREEKVRESSSSTLSLSLDGGVGGVVY